MQKLKQTSAQIFSFITNHKVETSVSLACSIIGVVIALWDTDAPIVIDNDALHLSFSQQGLRVGEALTATLFSTSELNFKDLECVWHLSPAGFMSITEQETSSDRCTATIQSASKPSIDMETMGSAGARQTYTIEAVLKIGDSVLGRAIDNLEGLNYLTPKTKITGAPLSTSTPVKVALIDAHNESLNSAYTCVWPQFPPALLFEADTPNGCSGVYKMPAGVQVTRSFNTMQIFHNTVIVNLDGRRVGVSRFQIPIER